MSEYTNIVVINDSIGTAEFARLLAGRYRVRLLSEELLGAAIAADEDALAGFTAEEQKTAEEMLTKVDGLIDTASKKVDDGLRKIDGLNLPLTQTVIDNSSLPDITEKIVLFNLDFNPDETARLRFKDAVKALEGYGNGKTKLPITAPEIVQPARRKFLTRKPTSKLLAGY